jgi:hypothetical protein
MKNSFSIIKIISLFIFFNNLYIILSDEEYLYGRDYTQVINNFSINFRFQDDIKLFRKYYKREGSVVSYDKKLRLLPETKNTINMIQSRGVIFNINFLIKI